MSIITGLFSWLGAESQNANIDFSKMLLAGINIIGPSIFILGLGIFVFGILPRFTTILLYIVTVWSFIIDLIGPSINLNKAILDTSILYHISLVPAADMNWTTFMILISIGMIGCILGSYLFNRRDLENE